MLKHENMQIIFYQNLYLFVPFCTHALPLGEAKHKPPNCTIQYENFVVSRGYFFCGFFRGYFRGYFCGYSVRFVAIFIAWLFF